MTRRIIETYWDSKSKTWRVTPPNRKSTPPKTKSRRRNRSTAQDIKERVQALAILGVVVAIAIAIFFAIPSQEDRDAPLARELADAHREHVEWERKFGCTLGAGTTEKHWGVHQGNIDLTENAQLWREDGTISLVAVKFPWDEASEKWLFPTS